MTTATAEAPKAVSAFDHIEKGEFGRAKNTSMGWVDFDEIHAPDALNARQDYNTEDLDEMYRSIIANNGIYTPIVLVKNAPGNTVTDKPYTLVTGYRRYKGMGLVKSRCEQKGENPQLYNTHHIPALLIEASNQTSFSMVQLVENLIRSDLNPIEIGNTIERIIKDADATGTPVTAASLAKDLGMSEAKISQLRAVAGLESFITKDVSEGKITFQNARLIAQLVPKKHRHQAAKMAKTFSGPEFEAKVRKLWGDTTTEAGAAGTSSEGSKQKRATRPPKDIRDAYLPELKKRLAGLEETIKADPTNKAAITQRFRLSAEIDAINWVLLEPGTEMEKTLADFEKQRVENAEKEKSNKVQDQAQNRLLAQLMSLMRAHINRPLNEGETKPTRKEALEVAIASLEKTYDKEKKTIPVDVTPNNKKSDPEQEQIFVDLTIPDLVKFREVLDAAWVNMEKTKAEKKAAKEKKAKEDEEKALAEKKEAELKASQGATQPAPADATTPVPAEDPSKAAPAASPVPAATPAAVPAAAGGVVSGAEAPVSAQPGPASDGTGQVVGTTDQQKPAAS